MQKNNIFFACEASFDTLLWKYVIILTDETNTWHLLKTWKYSEKVNIISKDNCDPYLDKECKDKNITSAYVLQKSYVWRFLNKKRVEKKHEETADSASQPSTLTLLSWSNIKFAFKTICTGWSKYHGHLISSASPSGLGFFVKELFFGLIFELLIFGKV